MIAGVSSTPRTPRSDSPSPNELTVEQLAAESGMSVRNIRAHQARGLLAPPEVRMRVGYYGPEHLAQLRLIRDLQADGFNLGGIKRLLQDTDGTAERLLSFKQALSTSEEAERAETLSLRELAQRFRVSAEEAPEVLAQAQKLGVLVPVGGDQYEVPSPSLLAVAEEVVGRGISLQSALAVLKEIERHCDSVSRSFVKLFLREVWKPFEQADMPSERWPEIEQAVERLRPIASEALMAIFRQRLGTQIEGAFGEITRRLSTEGKQ
jgi:DNA-binding transcriptional MerR regulator